jgi:hypothetical protein
LAKQLEGPIDDTLLLHRDVDLDEGRVEADGTFDALDGRAIPLAEVEVDNQEIYQIYAELEAGNISNQDWLFELQRNKVDAPEPPDLRGYEWDFMMCPISLVRFVDPVVACDGHTYEWRYIEEHFRNSAHSPLNVRRLDDMGDRGGRSRRGWHVCDAGRGGQCL